tara:strand:- start:34 stop:513 length:480 start_codon:yes stop_codon:yes gene_type:complete
MIRERIEQSLKACTKCDKKKPLSDFNYRNKSKGTYQAHCRPCTKSYLKKHYTHNQAYYIKKAAHHTRRYEKIAQKTIFEIKMSNPCITCGERDPRVLDFDHIQPSEKLHSVANMVKGGYSLDRILDEIEKCQILCANCHRRKTAEYFKYYTQLEYDAGE